MKMNEVTGTGNWNTAEYWEYATRSGLRANPDPITDPSVSPYAVFYGNPILKSDVLGNDPNTYSIDGKTGAFTKVDDKGGDKTDYINVKGAQGIKIADKEVFGGDYSYTKDVKTTVVGSGYSQFLSFRGPGEKIIGSASSGRADMVDDPITMFGPGLAANLSKKVAGVAVERLAASLSVKQSSSVVFHSTTTKGAAESILSGINPQYFNSSSRFGKGFYVANSEATTAAEIAYHGGVKINTIRYNLVGAKLMNATSPGINVGVKYAPRQLSWLSRSLGFDGIRYNSLRNPGGVNTVIFKNFDVLKDAKIIK